MSENLKMGETSTGFHEEIKRAGSETLKEAEISVLLQSFVRIHDKPHQPVVETKSKLLQIRQDTRVVTFPPSLTPVVKPVTG